MSFKQLIDEYTMQDANELTNFARCRSLAQLLTVIFIYGLSLSITLFKLLQSFAKGVSGGGVN